MKKQYLTLVVEVAEVPVAVEGGHALVEKDQLNHRQRVVYAYRVKISEGLYSS